LKATHTGLGLSEFIDKIEMMITQTMSPFTVLICNLRKFHPQLKKVRPARLNKEAKLHFLYTKSHLQEDMLTISKKVQILFVTFFGPKAYLLSNI